MSIQERAMIGDRLTGPFFGADQRDRLELGTRGVVHKLVDQPQDGEVIVRTPSRLDEIVWFKPQSGHNITLDRVC